MNNWEERLEEKSIDSSALFFQMYHKRVITLEDAEQFISQLLKEQKSNIKKELRNHGYGSFGIQQIIDDTPEGEAK